jgi:hypothetical protein
LGAFSHSKLQLLRRWDDCRKAGRISKFKFSELSI